MGTLLETKGADFRANGIKIISNDLDITNLVAQNSHYQPCYSLSSFWGYNGTANNKRCCVTPMSFQSIGIDVLDFTAIELTLKDGFDYVFGTGVAVGRGDSWQGWNGSTGGQEFAWVTDNQVARATVSSTTLSFCINLRYDDNTTTFNSNTKFTDIVHSLKLIR